MYTPSVVPLILCGGSGTRLWPVSRPQAPKRFVPLFNGTSLFQQTVGSWLGEDDIERLEDAYGGC